MDTRQFFRVAKALADPRRFEILQLIARQPGISCSALAARFPVGQPTISHHVKALADAELVEVRRLGQRASFRVRSEALRRYLKHLRLLTFASKESPKDRRNAGVGRSGPGRKRAVRVLRG